jgi:hypothetical protein
VPTENFEVEVTPTEHSRKNGYDLTIRQHGWVWSKSDLTIAQLKIVRNVVNDFIQQAENGVLINGQTSDEAYRDEKAE